jgi:hypothetical protein
VEHASRSSSLLHVEASWARVSQSGLKAGGCATAGDAHGNITEVASSPNKRRMGRCDGLCGTLLSLFYRFPCIMSEGHYGLFSLLFVPINRTLEG